MSTTEQDFHLSAEQVSNRVASTTSDDNVNLPLQHAAVHPSNAEGKRPLKKSRSSDGNSRELKDSITKHPSKSDEFNKSPTKKLEREAWVNYNTLSERIGKVKGSYLRDEDGQYYLLLEGRFIPLNYDRDNHQLNSLLLKHLEISLHTPAAKPTIARLIDAAQRSTARFKLRKFSAMSKDGKRLYIPLKAPTELLQVTANAIRIVTNGSNEDALFVQHPDLNPDGEPLDYFAGKNPIAGLADFERLIVNTQACQIEEMRWFVAIYEAVFVFVRDLYQARFIMDHEGPPGSGKTSGAEFISLLHGLEPTGDTTPASLRRLGDPGLLVMDNKEQHDMTQGFNNTLLFLATGTTSLRSAGESKVTKANRHRPIAVITSIEGAYKDEVRDRLVEVSYNAQERSERSTFPHDAIRAEIIRSRNHIVSALVPVLQRFLQRTEEQRNPTVPMHLSRFGGSFIAVCKLLRAYGDVAGKSGDWAEQLIHKWIQTIDAQSNATDGSELESAMLRFLRGLEKELPISAFGPNGDANRYIISSDKVTFRGQRGLLTITTADGLMEWFHTQHIYTAMLPKTSAALGKRLRSMQSDFVKVLDERNAPELKQLKRTRGLRPLGLFQSLDSNDK